MSGKGFKIKDHSREVLEELERRRNVVLEALGIEASGNAIDEINKLVYSKPNSETYVRTGRLKNSIAWATQSANDNADGTSPMQPGDSTPLSKPEEGLVYIGTNVEYASYVELGTVNMPSRPFLKNAISNYTDDYKRIIEEGLK